MICLTIESVSRKVVGRLRGSTSGVTNRTQNLEGRTRDAQGVCGRRGSHDNYEVSESLIEKFPSAMTGEFEYQIRSRPSTPTTSERLIYVTSVQAMFGLLTSLVKRSALFNDKTRGIESVIALLS